MTNYEDTYLNKLIQKVMVRNRRKDTILNDVKRNVHSVWINFTEEEQQVYEELNQFLQVIFISFQNNFFKRIMFFK